MGNESLDDVVIGVGVKLDAKGMKKLEKQLKENIKKSVNTLKGGFRELSSIKEPLEKAFESTKKSGKLTPTKGGFKPDQFLPLKEFNHQAKMFGNIMETPFETVKTKVKKTSIDTKKIMAEETKNFKKVQKAMAKSMEKPTMKFQGWAMSIMFFGMALKKTFNTIWKTSTKTFQDVMHSVDGTVTGFDMLNGSMDYLKFTAGQALEPIAKFLIPIVDWVSEWVLENDKLFAGLVATMGVLGTAFAAGGSGVLALNGFAELAIKMGLVSTEGTKITGVNWGILKSSFPIKVIAGLTALAVIAGLSWKAFKETPEAWESVKEAIDGIDFEGLKGALENFINVLLPGFKFGWEDIAWAIAYLVSTAVPRLNVFLGVIKAVISGVTSAFSAFAAFQALLFGTFQEKATALFIFNKNVRKSAEDAVAAIDNLGVAMDYVQPSFEEFKRTEQAKQKATAPLDVNYPPGASPGVQIGSIVLPPSLETDLIRREVMRIIQ